MSRKIVASIFAVAAVVVISSQAIAMPTDDFDLAQRVRSTMGVGAETVNVFADDGKVYLSGVVATEKERNYAENAAKNTQGVIAVENDIDIDSRGNE